MEDVKLRNDACARMGKMLSGKGTRTVRLRNGIYDEAKKISERENLMLIDFVNTAVAEKIIRES